MFHYEVWNLGLGLPSRGLEPRCLWNEDEAGARSEVP